MKTFVSIPASFEANQRNDLMEALETNGMTLTKQSLIDEPNAAFISYVHESQTSEKPLAINPNYNPKVLVFDFGGGTCDISILEIGKSVSGLYSKNIAISKFTKLGGDDVDRYITYHYLLPRFLSKNGKKSEDYITNERKFIASQLYKVAEKLKIQISKALAVKMNDFVMPDEKNSSTKASLTIPIEVRTSKGILSQSDFYLTYKELSDTMGVFTKNSKRATTIEGEEEYNNIFMPVVAIGTCILIGWIVKPKTVIDETTKNGEKFAGWGLKIGWVNHKNDKVHGFEISRQTLYVVMIKFIAPVLLCLLLLGSFGVFK